MATNKEIAIQELIGFMDMDETDFGSLLRVVADGAPLSPSVVSLSREIIHELIGIGSICVGDITTVQGQPTRVPWPGTKHEIIARVDREIDSLGTSASLGDGFWVWLSE